MLFMNTNNLKTPVVRFQYPDSSTNDMTFRFVRVSKMDKNYVEGFEVMNPYSTDQGKYKKYKLSRIAYGGVSLMSF